MPRKKVVDEAVAIAEQIEEPIRRVGEEVGKAVKKVSKRKSPLRKLTDDEKAKLKKVRDKHGLSKYMKAMNMVLRGGKSVASAIRAVNKM